MEKIINRLIKKDEIDTLLGEYRQKEKGIKIGRLDSFNIDLTISLLNLLIPRIDKCIDYSRQLNNGKLCRFGETANAVRMFTYSEYQDLFSTHIEPHEFCFYPVLNHLKRRGKVGVDTSKERQYFIDRYTNDEEGYSKALRENCNEPFREFFFGTRDGVKYAFLQLSAILPLRFLRMHLWILGATGSGKTWLLTLIFYRLVKKYKKFSHILIDVHGDISKVVKRHKRFVENPDRLIYINPFLKEGMTPSFNVFELGDGSIKERTHVAENLITSFTEIFENDDGRSEVQLNYLENITHFLFEREGSTLYDMKKLLACEEVILKEAMGHNPDFFNELYQKYNNRTRQSLLERVSRLMNNPVLYGLLAFKSTFDLEKAMNSGKVVVFDLGDMSELSTLIFGKLLIGSVKGIARIRTKNKYPCSTFLMLDEAHVLMSGTFNVLLEQLRGFGIHTILSHQYANQLGKQKESVKENCAIKIVGGFDDPDDVHTIIKVPKGTPKLHDFDFYIKVRHRRIQLFRTPRKFVTKRKKYEMTDAQEEKMDETTLRKFYRALGQTTQEDRSEKKTVKEKAPSGSPIPSFKLIIKE